MYDKIYTSDKDKYRLYINIKCKGRKNFRVWAEEYMKPNSIYAERQISVDGSRQIHFSFPYAPKQMFLGVLNSQSPTDKDFEIELIEGPLKTYNIWMDDKAKRFAAFAQKFTSICGYEEADPRGRLFRSPDAEFKIRYFPNVVNPLNGQVMNTPASIGHDTGIIYAAKNKMDNYTVAMRMMILEHEYSHKYRNPKIGLKISNEFGADINGLYMYLGMGYSKVDAICVFANVFLKAQTQSNILRMRKIMDYITRFENQEYAELE